MTSVIGLLGGTFDPIHNGHLAVARYLRTALDPARVHMIPSAVPPHRKAPVSAAPHRLAMLELALVGETGLVPDTRELHRTGPSYSLWTLRSLRAEFPDSPLCWIVGADAWPGVTSWYRWYELFSLAHFVVVKRPGFRLSPSRAAGLSPDMGELRRHSAGCCVSCDGPAVDVSASAIRRRIASGEDVSDSVPQAVWSYIRQQHLYGS